MDYQIYLDGVAAMLLAKLRLPGRTESAHRLDVDVALYRLGRHALPRLTRAKHVAELFAAMERRVERSPHGGPQDLRDWWEVEGRASMRAHVQRVRAERGQ
jgi:hypothetical protein